MATMAVSQTGERAGLDADVVLGFVRQLIQFLLAPADQRMVVRVAQSLEGDHGVEEPGKIAAKPSLPSKRADHPFLRLFEGAFAEGMDVAPGKMFGEFMHAVQPDEKIAPGEALRIAGQHQIALVKAVRIKLLQA